MKYYSQFGEDKWLMENIILPPKGIFVDVGAGDPQALSNSKLFEDLGWEVYCIEGDERRIKTLKAQRKNVIQAVISDKEKKALFNLDPAPDLSSLTNRKTSRTVEIKTRRLDKLFLDIGIWEIDILSVDVEGYEIQALKSLGMYKPEIIIVEFLTYKKDPIDREIKEYLSDYNQVHKTLSNLIFVLQRGKYVH